MIKSVLLADDSPTIRKVVELSFADSGLRLESVASGREALARLDTLHPDLVLADVAMPEPDGYELCRRIKSSARPVPVLLLAGTFEGFDPEQTRACGADGHLTKPFDIRALVQRVRDLLRPDDARAEVFAAPALDDAPAAESARVPELPVEAIEAIAQAVAQRLVGPLASELALELGARAGRTDDPAC